jgi:excisionase family DNA binding protein
VFSEALAKANVPVLDVAQRYSELGEALLPIINPAVAAKYGLEIKSFIIENVSLPPEVEQAIDKRGAMAAVGNLNDYVKFQMAQGLEHGAGGPGGIGAELAMGMAMANQMINQQGGILGGQGTPPVQGGGPVGAGGAPATAPAPAANGGGATVDLMTPAQVAQMLSVNESDVLASLEAGDLKGKRIGTQWRITRAAVDQFLHG